MAVRASHPGPRQRDVRGWGLADESAHEQPKYRVDASDPAAGKGGVVLDESLRFQPGVSGNPGGRPRGSSPRAVLLRKLAKDPNEHGEGRLAEEIADRALAIAQSLEHIDPKEADAAFKAFNAQLHLIHEVDGKPQERVEHSGQTRRSIIVHPSTPSATPPPLPMPDSE